MKSTTLAVFPSEALYEPHEFLAAFDLYFEYFVNNEMKLSVVAEC